MAARVPRAAWYATTPQPDGEMALAPWLATTCASMNRTTQTSATSLRSQGSNVPRGRNIGSGWGLSIEKAQTYTSVTDTSSPTTWNVFGGATVTGPPILAPDGQMEAATLTLGGGAPTGAMLVGGALPGDFTASVWVQALGNSPLTIEIFDFAGAVAPAVRTLVSGRWNQIDRIYAAALGNFPSIGMSAGGSGDYLVWGSGVQVNSFYTSSYVHVNGADVIRDADVLVMLNTFLLQPHGYFDIVMQYRPYYSNDTATVGGIHDLIYFDDDDGLRWNNSTGTFELRLGGGSVIATNAAFAANSLLTLRAASLPSGQVLELSGAISGNGVFTAAAHGPLVVQPVAYLLGGNGTGAQESSDLVSFSIFDLEG